MGRGMLAKRRPLECGGPCRWGDEPSLIHGDHQGRLLGSDMYVRGEGKETGISGREPSSLRG